MPKDNENPIGLLIPIGVLLIVMFAIGEPWLLVPIFILIILFISGVYQGQQIKSREREMDHWKAPEPGTYTSGHTPEPVFDEPKPIYEQKKRKNEGITCGTFIPIIIIGWLYIQTRSWVFLVVLAFIVFGLVQNIYNQSRGKTEVREQLRKETRGSVSAISDITGLPEERVRQHIVTEKRSGSSDVWFDPSSGEMTTTPTREVDAQTEKKVGCTYCGFALKPDDRFCPFCGAPIRA